MNLRRAWLAACVVLALSLNVTLPLWHEADSAARGNGERTAGDLMLDTLGEARTFLAKSMWLDVDVYHHALEGQGVPFADERDLMPLLKMVILLDPKFEEAYATAAYHLVLHFNRSEEGLALLRQGLMYQPRSRILRFERAFLCYRIKRYGEAADSAEAAFAVSTDTLDKLNALRLVLHGAAAQGHFARAIYAAHQWLALRPGDPTGLRMLAILEQGQDPNEENPAMPGPASPRPTETPTATNGSGNP